MKPITTTPVEITVLRWSENGESFADIAQKPSIIEHLGEKYPTPSPRIEKLKRMAKNAGWYQFQLRRQGKELPEPLPRLNETPRPAVQRADKSPAETPTLDPESAQPEELPQTEFGKLAAELKRPISQPPLDAARKVFQFPSGRTFESARHPERPGAPVDVRYEGGVVRKFVDGDGKPVVIVNVHRTGYSDETLNEETGEWVPQRSQ